MTLLEPALTSGFSDDPVGTHGSRTIMLKELRRLLECCPATAGLDDYRRAIVADNALGKDTLATRRESFRRLRELYALDPHVLLYRALRDLWTADVDAQPVIALLCACARDPILRSTAEVILHLPTGEPVTPTMISEAASRGFPERYNAMTLANIGRHAASSWQQSGHLSGRLRKVRSRAESRPASVTYALLLGHLRGERGEALIQTLWARLLDVPVHELREGAIVASQMGWLEYRSAGSVTEITFNYLLRDGGDGR